MEALPARTARAARAIRDASLVHITPRASADGFLGATILAQACARADIRCQVAASPSAPERGSQCVVIDLPAPDASVIACDHHHAPTDSPLSLQPRALGIPDGTITGAGMSYLLAKELHPANADLAWLALLGSLAELHDLPARRVVGLDREVVLHDAQAAGTVEARLDVRMRGRDVLPLPQMLAAADDPPLPGLRDEGVVERWLGDHGIAARVEGRPARWIDLGPLDQRRLLAALASHLLRRGSAQLARRLVGEVYLVAREPPGSPLRDARDLAFLVHALARRGRTDLAQRLLDGMRGGTLAEARALAGQHCAPPLAPTVRDGRALQHFDAGGMGPTGLAAVSHILAGAPGVRRDLPLVGFASLDHDAMAVVARASADVQRRGLRLGLAMCAAAASVAGSARGDDAQADATIPAGRSEEFLAALEGRLAEQMADAAI